MVFYPFTLSVHTIILSQMHSVLYTNGDTLSLRMPFNCLLRHFIFQYIAFPRSLLLYSPLTLISSNPITSIFLFLIMSTIYSSFLLYVAKLRAEHLKIFRVFPVSFSIFFPRSLPKRSVRSRGRSLLCEQ